MKKAIGHIVVGIVLLNIASVNLLYAAPFDRFLMPGKLIEGHKKTEKTCSNCHEAFDKKNQNKLCLKCHKKINTDVSTDSGFHGKNTLVLNEKCKSCHTDHVGRQASIVDFDRLGFNHKNSDFELKGFHKKTPCKSCHKANKKYRETPVECIKCHVNDDVHKKRLGEKCGDCHSSKNWKKAKFSHDKTKYKLKGSHKKVICGDCHPNQRFKPTPTKCVSCHKVQDIHLNEFGGKCEKCHVVKKWKDILFDHDKDTKFRLRNSHSKISCASCHIKNAYKVKLKKTCFSCHEFDDKHVGNFGEKCKNCHLDKAWSKNKFDHNTDTKFKLVATHKNTSCTSCHTGKIEQENLKTSCKSCHRADDIHNGKLKNTCSHCHSQVAWSKKIVFDHDLTAFPLLGLHGLAACETCHVSTEFSMRTFDCFSCHQDDDEHKLKLTNTCVQCHNPNGWAIWTFSHNKQTDYELNGEHEKIQCVACHTEKISKNKKIVLSDRCESCHADDDVHIGKFGKRCDRCHTTKTFKNVEKLK